MRFQFEGLPVTPPLRFALSSLALLSLLGCSSNATPKEERSLRPLAVVYSRYVSQHQGKRPKSMDDLKTFVQSLHGTDLGTMNLADRDGLFVSSRDGKPYVIVSGSTKPSANLNGAPIVLCENEGKDGKRFVANALGAVEEVDEARFRQLVPSAK
jgi:hypothetical protein